MRIRIDVGLSCHYYEGLGGVYLVFFRDSIWCFLYFRCLIFVFKSIVFFYKFNVWIYFKIYYVKVLIFKVFYGDEVFGGEIIVKLGDVGGFWFNRRKVLMKYIFLWVCRNKGDFLEGIICN